MCCANSSISLKWPPQLCYGNVPTTDSVSSPATRCHRAATCTVDDTAIGREHRAAAWTCDVAAIFPIKLKKGLVLLSDFFLYRHTQIW